jgi:hypothetical protein
MTTTTGTTTATERAQFTAALRELADFIDANPDLPLPPTYSRSARVSPHLDGTDEEERAEVDRIAGILGVSPQESGSGHYEAEREFGGRVWYRAVAISAARMAQHNALTSYSGAVTP